jgi:hypothetical protein
MHETPSLTTTRPTATAALDDLDRSVIGLGAVYPLLASPSSYPPDEEREMIDRMILAGLVAP